MADSKDSRATPLGIYDRPRAPGITGIEIAAIALSLGWLVLSGVFFLYFGGEGADGLRFILSMMVMFMPVAMIWETGKIDWAPELVVSLIYLVIGNSLISITLFVGLVHRGNATRISALMYLVPPLALIPLIGIIVLIVVGLTKVLAGVLGVLQLEPEAFLQAGAAGIISAN